MNIFSEQAAFAKAMGQTKPPGDRDAVLLYGRLVEEECDELHMALLEWATTGNLTEAADVLKEAIDLIYVTAGLVNAMGFDGMAAFREVHRSNMSKLGPNGKPVRRKDGKILKGPDYSPADMMPIVMSAIQNQKENA